MKQSILIIDDDLFHLDILEQMIARTSPEVSVCKAHNGLEATAHLREHDFSIIFCDLAMPEQDGFEFIASLSSEDKNIPVVFLSGVSTDVIEVAVTFAELYGVQHVRSISKPFNKEIILSHINWAHTLRKKHLHSIKNNQDSVSLDELVNGCSSGKVNLLYQPQYDSESLEIIGLDLCIELDNKKIKQTTRKNITSRSNNSTIENFLLDFLLDKPLTNFKSWLSINQSLMLTISVSSRIFSSPNFHDKVIETLNNKLIPIENITLEITESDYMENKLALIANASKLMSDGINLSLSNYGVGNSTLQDIIVGPFSQIAIDPKLLNSLLTSDKSRLAVCSIIGLINNLEVKSMVKEISTVNEYNLVKKMGCSVVQGDLFSCYLNAKDIDNILRLNHPPLYQ